MIFNTFYSSSVAHSALFRDTPTLFRTVSTWFRKHFTKGDVSQHLASKRVALAVRDAEFGQSRWHRSWGECAGRAAFAQAQSDQAVGRGRTPALWELSVQLIYGASA